MSVVSGAGLLSGGALAEEGGSGHYLPGSMSDFIDGVPAEETFLVRLNTIYYSGSAGITRPLPFAGLTTVGAQASSFGLGLSVLWRPPLEIGDGWSYAMGATIPFLRMDVSANVSTTFANGASVGVGRSSNTDALGDILLFPVMLNYKVNPDFNVNFRVGIYAPTGDYELGRLSNTGKNFWTVEPILGLAYFGQKNGIEVSAYLGSDFNTENNATQYASGTQLHIDGTVAQHFPWLGGVVGAGVSAYDYRQVTGDSGTGATLGPFLGGSIGLGPVVSYIGKIGTHDTIWELKWLHEVQTEDRLQGNLFWLKAVYKF